MPRLFKRYGSQCVVRYAALVYRTISSSWPPRVLDFTCLSMRAFYFLVRRREITRILYAGQISKPICECLIRSFNFDHGWGKPTYWVDVGAALNVCRGW